MRFRKSSTKTPTKGEPVRRPRATDYFDDLILGGYDELEIKHPTSELWLNDKIRTLCRKTSSTQFVWLLEKLGSSTTDPVVRGMVAKKTHLLRVGYLESFKEYSDRALIRLAEREKEFDQWEGIFILGCFGKQRARNYLQERLNCESNRLLAQTMERAIEKIKINEKKKRRERGF
ncbi:MAG: hypothetical protein ACE5G1_05865 [bacterium]